MDPVNTLSGYASFWHGVAIGLSVLVGGMLTLAHAAAGPSAASSISEKPFLLVGARVFDAEDGKTHEDWAVLVQGKTISAVGPKSEIQKPDSTTINLPDATLLPG